MDKAYCVVCEKEIPQGKRFCSHRCFLYFHVSTAMMQQQNTYRVFDRLDRCIAGQIQHTLPNDRPLVIETAEAEKHGIKRIYRTSKFWYNKKNDDVYIEHGNKLYSISADTIS